VLVAMERHSRLGFEMERSEKGEVVVYLPSAPNFITGTIAVVPAAQVTHMDIPLKKITDCMEQFGFGATEILGKPRQS
jgi:uncharacterized membrane protein